MRRIVSLGILGALAIVPQARAEDFTGVYAGVNAGYGFERGRDARKQAAMPDRGSATPAAANDLPPSAAFAAKSLQQGRPAASR